MRITSRLRWLRWKTNLGRGRATTIRHLIGLRCSMVGLGLMLGTLLSCLGLGCATAAAAEVRSLRFTFGSTGTGSGEFSQFSTLPSSPVAVDESTGDIYVGDPGGDRVEKFTAAGSFILMFGGEVDKTTHGDVCTAASGDTCQAGTPDPSPLGAGHGYFGPPGESTTGLAVDPTTHDVFVADREAQLIEKFSSQGVFLEQFTAPSDAGVRGGNALAVDSTGSLYVADGNGCGCVLKYSSSGQPDPTLPQIGFGVLMSSYAVAIGPGSDLYAVDAGAGDVDKFSSSGSLIETLDSGGNPTGVAVDLSTGNVYVEDNGLGTIIEYSSTGEDLGSAPPQGAPLGQTVGLAWDANTTSLLVPEFEESESGAGLGNFVAALGPIVVVPEVTTEASSNVQETTATLNGSVNASGVQLTSCTFEYGTTLSYEQRTPCEETLGSGTSPVPVHANVSGLAPNTVYHVRLSAGNANGMVNGGDQTMRTAGPPEVCQLSAFGITKTNATLAAELNPGGLATTYRFQYGTTTAYGSEAPIPAATLEARAECRSIETPAAGLQPGTTYHYRLVAQNSSGAITSTDETFTTEPIAQIVKVSATESTGQGAKLTATINPLGNDTTYQFEWGESTAYGHTLPAPGGDLGAGASPVSVSQSITGLSPGVTYHFRVTVKNALGEEHGADYTFVYDTAGIALPDGRAYEMVTPPHKNGAVIDAGLIKASPDIASDGSRVIIVSSQCFSGDSSSCAGDRQQEGEPYAMTRTESGWITEPLAPPPSELGAFSSFLVNANTNSALFSAPTSPDQQDDFYVRHGKAPAEDIGPATSPPLGPVGVIPFAGNDILASSNDEHVVYSLAASHWPFDPTLHRSLYEYSGVENSTPRLVGVSGGAGSTNAISDCGTELAGESAGAPHQAMSDTGNMIFFEAVGHGSHLSECPANTNAPEASELYARINGSLTVALSKPTLDCTTAACVNAPSADASFQGASTDGTKVFFADTQQLVDEASEDPAAGATAHAGCPVVNGANGCNLYEYDFARPEGHKLIDVSAGDVSGHGPRVQHILAISPDGSHVYFVARGVLTAADNSRGLSAQDGGENLYAYDNALDAQHGTITFIATLAKVGEHEQWLNGEVRPSVSPDGRYLVFTSHARLTTDDTSGPGAAQVFRYDDTSGSLIRLSIGENGFNDNGNVPSAASCNVTPCPADAALALPTNNTRRDPTMSDDGSYVFFTSPVGLTRGALDRVRINRPPSEPIYAENVYEYHEGNVSLISDGLDTAASSGGQSDVTLQGTDVTGANVFFTTSDSLVPQDGDTQLDLYDARICTTGSPCISLASPAPACTEGEECRGAPSPPILTSVTGTATFSGPGNLLPAIRAVSQLKLKRGAFNGTTLTVVVQVPGKGTIKVTGAQWRSTSRTVPAAGLYRLRVSLSSKARQKLRHHLRHAFRIRVSYRSATGSISKAELKVEVS